MLSKTKFNQLQEVLLRSYGEDEKTQEVIAAIAEVLGYDPDRKTYDPERYQANKEKAKEHYDRWVERKAEKGESLRPAGYYADYYRRNKEYLKQKRLERKVAVAI